MPSRRQAKKRRSPSRLRPGQSPRRRQRERQRGSKRVRRRVDRRPLKLLMWESVMFAARCILILMVLAMTALSGRALVADEPYDPLELPDVPEATPFDAV